MVDFSSSPPNDLKEIKSVLLFFTFYFFYFHPYFGTFLLKFGAAVPIKSYLFVSN